MVAFKDNKFRPNVQAAGIAKASPSSSTSLFIDEGIVPFAKPVIKKAQVTIKAIKYPNMPKIMPKKVFEVEESGHIYEEGIELKDARFGKVHRIYRLQRVNDGSNNEVYIRSEEKLAVKKLHKRAILHNREKAENPLHEIAALQLLASMPSSSQVPYVDCFADFETIYLITPYYNSGDLLDLIFYKQNLSQSFSITEMKEMFTQLVHQLLHLHSMGIVHRDLSLENILYDKDTKQYTIIDFGMSMRLKEEFALDDSDALAASNEEKESISFDSDVSTTTSSTSFASSMYDRFARMSNYVVCGKQHYIAPEIWDHQRDLELMYSDIWSLGVIFFMVMMYQAPFATAKRSDSNYNFFLHHNQSIEELIMQLNGDQSILATKPAEEHKQYEQLIDLMGHMLRPDHNERFTIEEVFQHAFFQ